MSESLQFVGNLWTGVGPVRKLILETDGERISRILPDDLNARRPGAFVLPETALVVPGLHDAHLHFLFGGLKLAWCDFRGVRSLAEFSDILSVYVRQTAIEPRGWIRGSGLVEADLKISRLDIDRVCPDVPVFIWTHDLHSAVANSAALIRARIDGSVKDTPGGTFGRDALGKLTGVLRGDAAMIVEKTIPEISESQAHEGFLRAQSLAHTFGVTAVTSSVHLEFLSHYLNFAESADRRLRLNVWKVSEHFDLEEDRFEKQSRSGFRYATFKGFADGSLGSRSAALWQSYADEPGNMGTPLVREGPLARFVRAAHGEGYQTAIHAIGDRANNICLGGFDMASTAGRGPEFRPRIEHAQHLREQDIPRFAQLGVIASMQPIHCTADMRVVEPRLGSERAKYSYAWKSLLDHGARLCFGSDWPVETMNPLAGIHAGVTRQDSEGNPKGGWQPQERISVAEALRAYTIGAAYASFWEDEQGTLEEGKLADFAVLSQNIFETEPREILSTRALMTVIGGKIAFSAEQSR